MSQPGIIYRMQWDTADTVRVPDTLNCPAKTVTVNIYDMGVLIDDADDPVIYTLTPYGQPLTMGVIDNNEDKFTTVRSKQATIRFLSDRTQGLDMTAFCDAADNRFKVMIDVVGFNLFTGFLMLSDMQQPFLPDPVVVELIASDHLGVLKDVTLVDAAGDNPQGKYRIADFLSFALRKTGLDLDIMVVNNLRHGSGSRTMNIVFVGGNSFEVANSDAYFFYVGQEFDITGSASNDGTYQVASFATGIVTVVTLVETTVGEAVVNVTIADASDGHIYDKIYLDAKTFEKNIGESEGCRTVLDKILGESCTLYQWRGQWWIRRTDEIDDHLTYVYKFNFDGTASGYQTPINPTRSIGANASICHANRGTNLRTERPGKFAKLTYRYTTPKEIVCNMDFSRGDVITPPDLGIESSIGTYALDCWTLRRISGGITSTSFITRHFVYGTEDQRYATVTPKTGTATPWDFIESQAIELEKGDRGAVSVDFRYDTDFGSGGVTVYPMRIYLKGDDGNWWYWWHPTSNDINEFYWTNAGTSEVERLIPVGWDAGTVDESQWQTLSVDLDALPVSGKLYIGLNQGHQVASGGSDQNINFQGLQFTYKPYINGSYQLFTGQANKITRATNPEDYNSIIDNEVFISDSPRKEFKGAMFWLDSNGTYHLVSRFWAANSFDLVPPTDAQFFHPYGFTQCRDVWNQYRNGNRIFPSSLYGLFRDVNPDEWPDLINKFALTDTNPNTDNRTFMLVSCSIDFKTTKWTGTFIEAYNSYTGRDYADPLVFSYLTS